MSFALLILALLGHAFLWVALVNRLHSVAMPRWATSMLTLLCLLCLLLIPTAYTWWAAKAGWPVGGEFPWPMRYSPPMLYLVLCWLGAIVAAVWWPWQSFAHRRSPVLRLDRTRSLELGAAVPASEEHAHHFLVRLPGNEILRLDVNDRTIDVPRLPAEQDGLSIVHFSDLHFTGRVAKGYFQEVVRRANEMQPDLIALTGDLVDRTDLIDWIPDTLGRLQARCGVYFVLGNHDVRVDVDRLRGVLHDHGLVDLGGRWIEVEVRGRPVVLAGNELPWLAPAADMTRCPKRDADGGPLRIVLSHSPDQLSWAQAQDVDLLLAGHTHGGQIRLPVIGPILAPSRLGVKYASGVFYAPPTIMHVTRGISGALPIRLNCPPEMAHLILRSQKRGHSTFSKK